MSVTIDKKGFNRELRTLALPIALQHLMLAAVAAADALMLGRVAQDQMTAVSLATQIQFVQNMFLTAVTGAGAILGAQYWGKKDRAALEDIFSLTLRWSGIICLMFFLACEFVPGTLMRLFTHDEDLIIIGGGYLRIAGWSYLITGVSQCCLTVMKVTGRVRPGAVISTLAVVLNVLFNAVFIFGLLGAPGMDARGAALATVLARVIELTACLVLTARPGWVKPALSRFFRLPRQLARDLMRQFLPLLGGALCWGVGFTSYTAVIGHMGTDPAAANSVAAVVRDLICCACQGVGIAAGIMVGNQLGAGNREMGKAYGIRLKNISWVIGFISTFVALAVTPLVVRMVILTDAARAYLTGMMVIMAVYMIGPRVNTVTINGVLAGGGDTLFDVYSLIVSMWCVAVPLAFLGAFVFHWHPLAVYACTCVDEVGKIPWVMARFRKYKWVRDLTRSEEELRT